PVRFVETQEVAGHVVNDSIRIEETGNNQSTNTSSRSAIKHSDLRIPGHVSDIIKMHDLLDLDVPASIYEDDIDIGGGVGGKW
ncbi:MAG: hypothetical protein Q9166_007745, partial [cf. Caloplaca sp. 2 TL-2023]